MTHHLAQLNIARFSLPQEHPNNAEFVDSLDRVNAVAEAQPGFIWRLKGEGNDAMDLQAFDDPNVIVNISVWADMDALGAFVYRNAAHRDIMHRRREWFDKIEFYLVLWWIREGHLPTVAEAKGRLSMLKDSGPSKDAFTFRHPFPPPGGDSVDPILDECA
ncbi:MAG: DUF3291 domain-containing protein [Pseudomonadota bacterium]